MRHDGLNVYHTTPETACVHGGQGHVNSETLDCKVSNADSQPPSAYCCCDLRFGLRSLARRCRLTEASQGVPHAMYVFIYADI
jgi:hypothetical protein